MAERVRPPYVLGLVRSQDGGEYELVLRRDGSVSARCLRTGAAWDGLSLHLAADELRAYREQSA